MGFLNSIFNSAPEVDVREASSRINEEGAFLLDVRERDEFREVRAVGAVRISLGQLPDRLAEVPRDRPVLVICRSGARSARAVGFLRQAGIDATNVGGGTGAWIRAGLPTTSGGAG